MQVSDFDYVLPAELIAQQPPPERDGGRLLALDRRTGAIQHASVRALPDLLAPGDLVAMNDSRVFPARLLGRRVPSGGAVECLLTRRLDRQHWEALVHPGQKLRPGARIEFGAAPLGIEGEVVERRFFGRRVLRLESPSGVDVEEVVEAIGHVPLPPYIRRPDDAGDRERYQTVYARATGSVAAPTAGLHLTPRMLARLSERGIEQVAITLHVGYGTFKPVRTERVEDHRVDAERFEISADAASRINSALEDGRRVIAIGTTTTRALESAALAGGRVHPGPRETDLFIYPGFEFRVVGGLLTNFHLPRSSLLMLVAAFAGRERVLAAYREAIALRYRFYSYGDAMLIL